MAELKRQYAAIPEPTADPAALLATLKAIKQNVEVLCGMRKAVPGLADQLTDISSSIEGASARFTEYVQVSTSNGRAIARRTTSLEAEMGTTKAKITEVEQTVADGDSALAERIDNLDASVGGTNTRITNVERAYADADSAIGERINSVSSSVTAVDGKITDLDGRVSGVDGRVTTVDARVTDEANTRATADEATARKFTAVESSFTAVDNRITGVDGRVSGVDGRVTTVDARVSDEAKTRADQDGALAQRITQVEASTDNGFANGKLAFIAGAAQSGYFASFDLILTSKALGDGKGAYAGLTAAARSLPDGTVEGSIFFTANTFRLYDPTIGNINTVFNYQNGVFTFNVPVVIDTLNVARRAITIPIFSRNTGGAQSGVASVTVDVADADTVVDLAAEFDGQPMVTYPLAVGQVGQRIYLMRYDADGTSNPVEIQSKLIPFYIDGEGNGRVVAFLYVGMLANHQPGRTGRFVFTVYTQTNYGPVTIKAIAAKR